MMASRETRLYGGEMLPDELDEALRVANQEVDMLAGLVLDDELREQVKAARSTLNQLGAWCAWTPGKRTRCSWLATRRSRRHRTR